MDDDLLKTSIRTLSNWGEKSLVQHLLREAYLQEISSADKEEKCAYCGKMVKKRDLCNAIVETETQKYMGDRVMRYTTHRNIVRVCPQCVAEIKNKRFLERFLLWFILPLIGFIIGITIRTSFYAGLTGLITGYAFSGIIYLFLCKFTERFNVKS